jgi:radical SAM protein with 4Fe4S-binding SPASM domain
MATLILKATEKCNSNCYYCDVVRKENTGRSMPLEILETTLMRVNEYLKDNPNENMNILWHGGEPLLLGPEYYRSAIELQLRHCADTKSRINHSIQTNLICFTREFVDILCELDISSIGTSYDPEPNIRGVGRKIDSDIYNKKFMNALKILESNDIGWGLIYVATKKSLANPLDVFYFLTNMSLRGGININPVLIYDDQRKDAAITPGEYVKFLGAIFSTWWEHRDRYPNVEPFKSLVNTIINGHQSLGCVDSGDCTYHHINISPNGDLSQCGRSADWGLLPYGNILTKTLEEVLCDRQRDELALRVDKLKTDDCKGCRFWKICHGGCPLDAFSKHKSFMHKSEWCEAKKGFIEKHFEPITGVKYSP